MSARHTNFEADCAVSSAGATGLSPHGRLTDDSLSSLAATNPQFSGPRLTESSRATHVGLTPGREGKGREQEGKGSSGETKSKPSSSVPREAATLGLGGEIRC